MDREEDSGSYPREPGENSTGNLGSDLELKGHSGLQVGWEVGQKPGTLLRALRNNSPNQTMKQNHSFSAEKALESHSTFSQDNRRV